MNDQTNEKFFTSIVSLHIDMEIYPWKISEVLKHLVAENPANPL